MSCSPSTTEFAASLISLGSSLTTSHPSSSTTSSLSSSAAAAPSNLFTFSVNQQQYIHQHPPSVVSPSTDHQQQQQQSVFKCSPYTHCSPVLFDQVSSSSCSPYPLPTPPLSNPVQHLRNYFFPAAVSQQPNQEPFNLKSLQKGNPEKSHSRSNSTEALAATLLQLQEPVIRSPAAVTISPTPSQSNAINGYYPSPFSVQSQWHPGWPYLPMVQQQQEYRSNPCHICGKTYARLSTLRSHLKSHTGEKPYQCSICQKSFTQAANLTAHLRTHSGEKPFKCPVCHRGFSQSSSVTTHMRTHSGDRPYKCNVCSKGFADSSTLTKHYRTHTGEKPYQCKICEARFSQSGNLNRHMRTHRQHFEAQPMQDLVSMDMGGVSLNMNNISNGMGVANMSKLEVVVPGNGGLLM